MKREIEKFLKTYTEPYTRTYEKGAEVKIISGLLVGARGTVVGSIQHGFNNSTEYATVKIRGRRKSITIPVCHLERVPLSTEEQLQMI